VLMLTKFLCKKAHNSNKRNFLTKSYLSDFKYKINESKESTIKIVSVETRIEVECSRNQQLNFFIGNNDRTGML